MALTQEQIAAKNAELEAYISENKDVEGVLIPVMQKAQELFGYLSLETMELISERLDVPVSEIYGVVTFYSFFSLTPKGKYVIGVCLGTACFVKGSEKLLDTAKEALKIKEGETTEDGKFSLEATRCIGACGLAPVFTVNDEVYGKATPELMKKVKSRDAQARDLFATCKKIFEVVRA